MSYPGDPAIIYLDSRDRLDGTSNFFTYEIPTGLLHDKNFACVMDASIPKSYYNIRSGQGSFTLRENDVDTLIIVPPATYNRKNLATTLQTLLNAASSTGSTYVITYANPGSPDTGKYTFTITPHEDLSSAAFIFDNQSEINENLGFALDSVNPFTLFGAGTSDSFTTGVLVSPGVVDLSGEHTLYIRTSLVVDSQGSNILQPIQASGDISFGTISFQQWNIDVNKKRLSTTDSNIFQFWLCNERSHSIDLNLKDWVCTILLLP